MELLLFMLFHRLGWAEMLWKWLKKDLFFKQLKWNQVLVTMLINWNQTFKEFGKRGHVHVMLEEMHVWKWLVQSSQKTLLSLIPLIHSKQDLHFSSPLEKFVSWSALICLIPWGRSGGVSLCVCAVIHSCLFTLVAVNNRLQD